MQKLLRVEQRRNDGKHYQIIGVVAILTAENSAADHGILAIIRLLYLNNTEYS